MEPVEGIRDCTFRAIANILSHYKTTNASYDVTKDMGIILEYITHLESLLRKESQNEND